MNCRRILNNAKQRQTGIKRPLRPSIQKNSKGFQNVFKSPLLTFFMRDCKDQCDQYRMASPSLMPNAFMSFVSNHLRTVTCTRKRATFCKIDLIAFQLSNLSKLQNKYNSNSNGKVAILLHYVFRFYTIHFNMRPSQSMNILNF
jgi:hypothetical protein